MFDRFAILATIAFALAACGGGGSGSQSNMMPPMTPTEPAAPERELSVGAGLTIGSQSPIHATTAADTRVARLANPTNKFRAYSASIVRNFSAATAKISDRYSINAVRSDGDYGLHVTYGDKEGTPTETEIHFPKTLVDEHGSFAHEELGYWLWALSSTPFNGMNYASTTDGHVAWIGSTVWQSHGGGRFMAVYGLETPTDALPTGQATYSGIGYAEMFDNSLGTVAFDTGRTRLNYDVTLNVDFADNSLTGRIDMTQIRRPGSDDRETFTGTGFDVTGGAIVDGQFTASLTGTDANPNAPLADSMRGFEGDAVGAFYGPAGGTAGGVITAERNMDGVHRVMMGTMYGAQDSDN